MLDIGRITRRMAKERLSIAIIHDMKENERMIYIMDSENLHL